MSSIFPIDHSASRALSQLRKRMSRPELLTRALTHRSAGREHYERLEFLGDALINSMVAETLYHRFPRADEGQLSRLRARVVNQSALAEASRRLNMGDALVLGAGELKSGGYRRDSILSDAFEAVVAAMYLDPAVDDWKAISLSWLKVELDALQHGMEVKDPKTRLQEWLQSRQHALPVYDLIETRGDDHEREFLVRCSLSDLGQSAEAVGVSRRAAEQQTAERLMLVLEAEYK